MKPSAKGGHLGQFHMGINMGHDRSVAVVENGKIIIAIEQERLDRIKHSVGFMLQAPHDMELVQVPGESIAYCLDHFGIPLSAMATITANMPGEDLAPQIMRGKFSAELADRLRTIPSHHLAHAYSAFWPSGFDEALVLVVDASGSITENREGRRTESYTLYEGRGTELKEIHSERVKSHLAALSTIGFVYEAVSRRAGFVTNLKSGLSFPESGKLMGLAAYGGPQDNWQNWMASEKSSFEIKMSAYDIFLEMAALEKRYDDGQGKPYFRPWLVDLAYKVQAELEQILSDLVSEACQKTRLNKLCIAGGVGLNSVANYKILQNCGLENVFTFPAAADNGIAAGCALWAYHTQEGGRERPALGSVCFGRSYSKNEVDAAIDAFSDRIDVQQHEPEDLTHQVAKALTRGNIVARFESGSEYGPRALGHRSILADPAFERMKDVVNARVKFREAFRPFAPFVPLERANEVFDLSIPSPYMLLVAPVRQEYREKLPAITHQDGTGRVQTCTSDQNPFFHDLCLEAERIRGGVPVLLNTSFNVAGQPIVETPEQAIETFLRTDIDYLALEDRWIKRSHQPVKDYSDHILDLPKEPLPHGLEPNQPSVLALMEELDEAIFRGAQSQSWSETEVTALSSQGARFKETSKLFPQTPFLVPLKTQLSENATLIVDPHTQSLLIDETGKLADLPLDMNQVHTVLALQHDPGTLSENLRLEFRSTPVEFDELIMQMIKVLEQFKVPIAGGWIDRFIEETQLDPIPSFSNTLGVFENEDFRLDQQLRVIRRTILDHGYDEQSICELLAVESLQTIEPTKLHYLDKHVLPQTPRADLIRLFQLRGSVPQQSIEEIFGQQNTNLLESLGMLNRKGDEFSSAIDLFCCGGLLFATDHRYMIQADDHLDEDPVMYIGMDSHGLVQTAPREHCEHVLDLCSGSGVQGIVASRYARNVTAVDINPRAIRFARFNAQLNGIENYHAKLGNLYDVVDNQKFDCILANPPFVPSPDEGLKFRDGGVSGENILRSIIEGSWSHLTAEGRLCIVTDLVNVETYNQKLSSWLGQVNAYGLILSTADRDEILFSVPHCHAPFSQSLEDYNRELERWINNFRGADLKAVNFGYILLWKRPEEVGCDLTQRTIHNPTTPIWEQVQDWLEQRQYWDSNQSDPMILALHPELRINTEETIGSDEHQVELRFGENPFFTTYGITNRIADELRRIYLTEPELKRILDSSESWIEKLHRLGILRLNKRRRILSGESNNNPGNRKETVEEHATKTTPTCLSTYLG